MTPKSPFENETWVRNCIANGSITPPRDHQSDRATRLTAYAVTALVILGGTITWGAVLWK